ncbi:MAG: DNA internalization-related competence protein ComEC/Rec2 [Pseudomonadota bacterium]|nr:DNA internalization-related competence protein ComEC/Rec2 [Pseudomonadota bacterium]
MQLRLRTPRGSFNPGGFDYEAWLLRERIVATASVVKAEPCEAVARNPAQWILTLRQDIVDLIDRAVGEGRAAAMMAALAVGNTADLGDADWQLFRETGTTHLIAISGFNLGVVSGFIFLLLRWMWSLWPRLCLQIPAQRVGLLGSGIAAAFYALLAGFDPPVLRALIMLLMLIIAGLLNRLQQVTRVLSYAWVLILLLDPFAVLSPGLWLSFGAVLAILSVSRGRLRLPRAWRLALSVQWMLSFALIPLTLYFFEGFAWLSPLVNLLAVPLFSVLTPLVLVAVAAMTIYFPLGAWIGQQLAWVFDALVSGLEWTLALAPSPWISASPPWPVLVLGVFGAVLLWLPRGVPLRMLALACVAALALPRQQLPTELAVTALDVGQGTAVVVRTTSHTLLVDAGPAFKDGFDAGRSVVVPYLLSQGITQLDALVVSHDDNDHAGGVAAVRSLLPVLRVIGTADGEVCTDGMHWRWDDVDFRVLHPAGSHGSENNRSCVLLIEGAYRILLPGDIERAGERRLLRERRDVLAADVLLTPHHGSRTSSTREFVEAVGADVVVHSAAWRSRFGHPRSEVVERYAAEGAAQYTTGVSGAIRIEQAEDGSFGIHAARPEGARWWHAADTP